MTQQEFDERKRDAMIVCPGGSIQFFDNNGNSIFVDVWLYYEGIDELEHRFNNGLSVERFKRPLSCIKTEGRTVKVRFRTDLTGTDFLRLLRDKLRHGGAGLDVLRFAGLEDDTETEK